MTFTFIKPGVAQVLLTYNDNSPVEINEEFKDQGEHYYGIWEYPFGGNIDNRGADWDFLGMRQMPGDVWWRTWRTLPPKRCSTDPDYSSQGQWPTPGGDLRPNIR